VNAASFDSQALSPGAIFSIFGQNLPQSTASAQVLVNGQMAPVFFASSSQVNAQIPYEAPTDQPVSLSVSGGGVQSNTVLLNIHQTGPGIFAYGGNHAVVQNHDYSVNSPTNPTQAGDFVVAYLTGGGSVNPAVPTGVFPPTAPLSYVSAPYTFTIGGIPAKVTFFGLTPGFPGLYQANLEVPALSPGDYTLVATVAGVPSNGPIISVR
jgi:adhesin/invasin